jgi:hypothetical protein
MSPKTCSKPAGEMISRMGKLLVVHRLLEVEERLPTREPRRNG